MTNNNKPMFGGIEVISFGSDGNRDSKIEKEFKKGLLNYGVKKGYIKQDENKLNSLKKKEVV